LWASRFGRGSMKGNRLPFQAFHFFAVFPDFQKLVFRHLAE